LFGLSRQGIYQSEERNQHRAEELSQIKPLVQKIRMEMPRIGTRKLYYLLKGEINKNGIKIGRDGLFRYLRSENMLIHPLKSYTKTTNSKHWLRKHPNLLKDLKIERPEQVFVSDITYLKSREKTHYLSLVTDAYSRKIMGYKLSHDMSAEHMTQALKMAIKNRTSNQSLIHHSDRGLQYCSLLYQNELQKHAITPSMTDGYDCYQNALAERVNGILKQEFLMTICNNSKDLEMLIKESIKIYNTKRPHLSLNMETPEFTHKKTMEVNFHGF
jgi:transposase InsO family protein